jgi:hypothetical protein
MAKGFVLEVLQMAIVAILCVSVIYFWFSGKGRVEPAPLTYTTVECKSHVDCTGNSNGPDCISNFDSPTFCGCLDDSECQQISPTLSCFNYKCIGGIA